MNADSFRRLYDNYFALIRRLWVQVVAPLPPEQFRRPAGYSIGSFRNSVVHKRNMEDRWFSALFAQNYALFVMSPL